MAANPSAPRQRSYPPLAIKIPYRTVVGLRRAAAARDVPVRSLITSVLDVIGEEPDLVRAILDDGGDAA